MRASAGRTEEKKKREENLRSRRRRRSASAAAASFRWPTGLPRTHGLMECIFSSFEEAGGLVNLCPLKRKNKRKNKEQL
ncbi:Os07g0452950 [Oryza sativa Japonica Group]|uniref:Os07g0452950 protein n=1 Tax=Oryza sativa subsp. japonica TaxID=39947 RepID=A0A0P0X5T4_ORYSJ|nr:hypothetical protein EE612_038960 [Oryza sativa]BAT01326.1 Os07g0452950 [Oryza sativa Japonica Group]